MIDRDILIEGIRNSRRSEGRTSGKLVWDEATIYICDDMSSNASVAIHIPFVITDQDYYNNLNDCFLKDVWEGIDGLLKRKGLYPKNEKFSELEITGRNKVYFKVYDLTDAELIKYATTGFNLMVRRIKKNTCQ